MIEVRRTTSPEKFLTTLQTVLSAHLRTKVRSMYVRDARLSPTKDHLVQHVSHMITRNPQLQQLWIAVDTLQKSTPSLSNTDRSNLIKLLISHTETMLAQAITQSLENNPMLSANFLLSEPDLDSVMDSMNETVNNIITFKSERELARKQQRIQDNLDKKICRLDSFAELLEPSPSHSICVGLTIVNDKLLIASNNAGRGTSEAILHSLLSQKLTCLRTFFGSIQEKNIVIPHFDPHSDTSIEQYYMDSIDLLTTDAELEQVISTLLNISPSEIAQPVLKQALIKLIKTLFIDKGPFSPQEKSLFLTHGNHTILLPKSQRSSDPTAHAFSMEIYTTNAFNHTTVSSHDLGLFSAQVKVHNLHAEQLLIKFLNIPGVTSESTVYPIRIGISKLCCADCHHVISDNDQFKARGTSGRIFPNTANIEQRTARTMEGTPDYHGAPCVKDASPIFSPGEPYVKRPRYERVPSSSSASMFGGALFYHNAASQSSSFAFGSGQEGQRLDSSAEDSTDGYPGKQENQSFSG